MIIETTKTFDKQYSKLNDKTKTIYKSRIAIFQSNPFDFRLRNHALKGKYLGFRSIDITGDVRALYTVKGNIIIIFGFIGSHSQLYR
jgi:addiction module RelE/StbE family toxin